MNTRIDTLERQVNKLFQAPTMPVYDFSGGTNTLPQDAVQGQVVIGFDGSFNWFSNGYWHTQLGVLSNVGNVPQDVVEGQVAIGNDGSFHWYVSGRWWTAPFAPSTDINSPQDVIAGQIVIGMDDDTFHWSPGGVQSYP